MADEDRNHAAERIGLNIQAMQGERTNIDVVRAIKDRVIHASQLSEWRQGSILPEITVLITLAREFNCSLDDLVRGVDTTYDAAAKLRRSADLDADEAILVAMWDTIRQDNPEEAFGYLAQFRTRVESMLGRAKQAPARRRAKANDHRK